MHSYGTDLIHHCPALIDEMLASLEPLAQVLYLSGSFPTSLSPERTHAESISTFSAHAIGYGTGALRETALRRHVDQSDFTISACLGCADYEGAELTFEGMQDYRIQPELPSRGLQILKKMQIDAKRSTFTGSATTDTTVIKPKPGCGLMHFGKHPHWTSKIVSGERFNFVIWLHSKPASASADSDA
jgi:hypothetical protein